MNEAAATKKTLEAQALAVKRQREISDNLEKNLADLRKAHDAAIAKVRFYAL